MSSAFLQEGWLHVPWACQCGMILMHPLAAKACLFSIDTQWYQEIQRDSPKAEREREREREKKRKTGKRSLKGALLTALALGRVAQRLHMCERVCVCVSE